jgi:large subunit ribosomal protein L23
MDVLKPRLSEKAYAISVTTNTFVIDVPRELNKHEIAASVERQFEVSVKSVRVINRKGKTKRVMNTTGKRYSNRQGVQSDIKKAYITLNTGSHLPFFEAEEAEAKEVAKTEKTNKKAAKAEKKTSGKKEEKK